MSAAKKQLPKGDGLVPKASAEALSRIFMGVAAVGVALSAAGYFSDPARFPYSWLVGFVFVWTICMGGLFFTIIHHLTRASWSVGPRRVMEWLARGLPACAVVFLPILAFSKSIFRWLKPEAAHDELIHAKSAYLNQGFFLVRVVVFFGLWIILSGFFAGKSREQDASGDRKLSERLQGMAAPSTALFALSITFAGFDWMMSLDPHWYSTMFGVYVFAGSLVGSHAVLALATMRINKERWGGDVVTTEHQHDVGKYLFAWVVFWAYIGFSQFMLIWYANIPEETVFYRHRWDHGWSVVSLSLFIGHFVLPFLILLSRTAKRSGILALGAVLLLVMHYVDIYWLVMPNFSPDPHEAGHFAPSWIDLAGLLAPLGLVGTWVSRRALVDPVIPMKDPYLPDAMKAENLV